LTEDLTLVADESLRCGNIVKNLLLFARNKETSFQQANLTPIIDRCVKLMGHHAKVHGVKTEVDVLGDLTLECNPNEMEQVLIALTVNAIEAMSGSGNPGGTVLIAATKPSDKEIHLKVSDTGIGMSEEIREHIFEPFFTTKSNEKGVGLGLAVAYGIIQRHHGTIQLESSPGKGTTFTITLPVKQPAPATSESVHA
jgi:two-component system NtrC family sensor kinase